MTVPMQAEAALFSAVQDANAEAAEAIMGTFTSEKARTYALAAIEPVATRVNEAQALAVLGYVRRDGTPGREEPVTVHASTEGLRVYRDSEGLHGSPWLHPDGALTQEPPE